MRGFRVWVARGVLALAAAWCVEVARSSYTCAVCRLLRVDTECLGIVRSRYSENECSRWYVAHVEPTHGHVWRQGACTRLNNLFGVRTGFACRRDDPVWQIPPLFQQQIYQRFQDPREAKALFQNLSDADARDDRGRPTVRALVEWEAQGFPDTWDLWWARSRGEASVELPAVR